VLSANAADRRSSEMCALPDGVCLAQPGGELVIELFGSDDAEVMYEQPLRVRARPPDARIDDAPLQVEVPGQGCLSGSEAGESAAGAFQRDRRLRDRVAERPTGLGEPDELVVQLDDLLGLVAQMALDRPLLGHQARLAEGAASTRCDHSVVTKLAALAMCALAGAAIATAAVRGSANDGGDHSTPAVATFEGELPPGEVCYQDEAISVPWVVGQEQRIAVETLRQAGFGVAVRRASRGEVEPTLQPGTAVKQFPPRGWDLCKGLTVSLTVSVLSVPESSP
jgi:hypothetical protein